MRNIKRMLSNESLYDSDQDLALPLPKRARLDLRNTIVTFIVDEDGSEAIFDIPKKEIITASPIFAAIFTNPNTHEGQTQTYRLEHIPCNAFRLFTHWLTSSSSSIPLNHPQPHHPPTLTHSITDLQETSLVTLWLFGRDFHMPALQNDIFLAFEALHPLDELSATTGSATWYPYVYENTREGCELRRYAVERELRMPGDFRERREFLPTEMLFDMLEVVRGEGWIGKREGLEIEDFLVRVDDEVVSRSVTVECSE